MSAVLLTSLKIADLVALTAREAGRMLLPAGIRLDSLRREELYLFEPAPGYDANAFEEPLRHAIETSNFFVNPNKERYRFLGASDRVGGLRPPPGSWGLLTRTRDDTSEEGLRRRLLAEHPLPGLGSVRRGRVWWMESRDETGGAAIEAAFAALGPVIGPGRGLLFNPHGEAALKLDGVVGWSVIDAFLADPVPPFQAVDAAEARA